jgi:hypothetical protein
LLQVKFAVYDGNFELPEMVVALSYVSSRIGLGRSDCVKPCFDITQFGSLYSGFIQSLNVSKSSNSGGTPVMKFEHHDNIA